LQGVFLRLDIMSDKDLESVPDDLKAPLIEAWRDFQVARGAVRKNLIDDERAGYQGCGVNASGETVSAHGLASELYTDCEREDGDDAKRSNHGFGVIVVSPKTAGALHLLNEAKSQMIYVLDNLKAQQVFPLEAIKSAAGISRIHYYKIKRPAKGFESDRIESIRLSIEQKIDVGKRTIEECEDLLERYDVSQPHIQVQLDLLSRLPRDEPLAYVFETTNVRIVANASYPKDPNTNRREHFKQRSVMPFYVVSDDPAWAPEIKLPQHMTLEDRVARKERRDRRINPDPLLPSIHVHQYLA